MWTDTIIMIHWYVNNYYVYLLFQIYSSGPDMLLTGMNMVDPFFFISGFLLSISPVFNKSGPVWFKLTFPMINRIVRWIHFNITLFKWLYYNIKLSREGFQILMDNVSVVGSWNLLREDFLIRTVWIIRLKWNYILLFY